MGKGIAYSCNISGMTSPIASPQNLVANSALEASGQEPISFFQWVVVGGFTSLFGVLLTYFFLLAFFRIPASSSRFSLKTFDSSDVELDQKSIFVLVVTFITIFIWCLASLPSIKVFHFLSCCCVFLSFSKITQKITQKITHTNRSQPLEMWHYLEPYQWLSF